MFLEEFQNYRHFTSTSWNTFDIDDIDFGLGEPVWSGLLGKTSRTQPTSSNLMILKPVAGDKSAMEAWVTLVEQI